MTTIQVTVKEENAPASKRARFEAIDAEIDGILTSKDEAYEALGKKYVTDVKEQDRIPGVVAALHFLRHTLDASQLSKVNAADIKFVSDAMGETGVVYTSAMNAAFSSGPTRQKLLQQCGHDVRGFEYARECRIDRDTLIVTDGLLGEVAGRFPNLKSMKLDLNLEVSGYFGTLDKKEAPAEQLNPLYAMIFKKVCSRIAEYENLTELELKVTLKSSWCDLPLKTLLEAVPKSVTRLAIQVNQEKIPELWETGLDNVESLEVINRGMFYRNFVNCFKSPQDFTAAWPSLTKLAYRGGVSTPDVDDMTTADAASEEVKVLTNTLKRWLDDSPIELTINKFVCPCGETKRMRVTRAIVGMMHRDGVRDAQIVQGF